MTNIFLVSHILLLFHLLLLFYCYLNKSLNYEELGNLWQLIWALLHSLLYRQLFVAREKGKVRRYRYMSLEKTFSGIRM